MSKNASQLKRFPVQKVQSEFIAFKGGWDDETPPLFISPGVCREVQNYECSLNGGYSRVMGYERHDGRTAPSSANYAIVNVTITGAFATDDTITGVTSGATGVVVAVVTTTTPDYLVITKIAGTFVSGETLNVGGNPQGTTSSAATVDGASSPLLHATYKNLAADQYRADIAAIPGTGNVLGVVRYNGVTYGWRNNAGGTAAACYKSSTSGWTLVPVGEEVSFTGGNSSVGEGDTLTQGGVTATIKRLVVTSGTTPNIVGRLIIYGRAGGNFVAGAATSTGAGALTLDGAETAIAVAAGGRYELVVENLGGSLGTKRVYGCDGANRGFEFDGSDYGYTPISTGMASDIPTHIAVHKNHLFFSFAGGSVQHSGPGTPYVWSAILGASELAMGDTVNGFATQPGTENTGALAIFTRNRTSILYGTGVASWSLVPYRAELGAYAYTIQDIGSTLFLDDIGVTTLATAQAYGNFTHAALSNKIKTWMNTQRTKATASCAIRNKSQYRLFFSDQYALFLTMVGNKVLGMMPVYLANAARCAWSSEDSDGTEVVYFGSTNGMVYQMEKGTSFDGENIEHYIRLVFNFSKSPRVDKSYSSCMLEALGDGYADFNFSYVLGYDSTDIEQPGIENNALSFASGVWDAAGAVWDVGYWDGHSLLPTEFDMVGTAVNVSLTMAGTSDFHEAITFSGAMINFIPRRIIH